MKTLLICGLACVVSIAAYSGVSVALVRETAGPDSNSAAYLAAYVFMHENRDANSIVQTVQRTHECGE